MGLLILDFPRTLAIPILASWIYAEDLGFLDSSICNRSLRQVFLARIKDEYFCSSGNQKALGVSFYLWLKLRNIKVSSLNFNFNFAEEEFSSLSLPAHLCQQYLCSSEAAELKRLLQSQLLWNKVNNLTILMEFNTKSKVFLETCLPFIKCATLKCFSLAGNEIELLMSLLKSWSSVIEHFHLGSCSLPDLQDSSPESDCDSDGEYSEYENSDESVSDNDSDNNNDNDSDSDSSGDDDSDYDSIEIEKYESPAVNDSLLFELRCLYFPEKHSQLTFLTSIVCTFVCITDYIFIQIVKMSPNLVHINVANCGLISNHSMFEISKNCQLVKYLNIEQCNDVTTIGLQAIVECCVLLEDVNISFCERIDSAILENCPNLTSVSLFRSLLIIEESIVGLAHKNKLRQLAIHVNSFSDIILKHCSILIRLTISDHNGLTDAIVNGPFSSCDSLQELFVSKIKFSSVGIEEIIKCRLLETVDLSFCYTLSEENIINIVENCTMLKVVLLVDCNVTNNTLATLSYLHFLEKLDISCCNRVDMTAIYDMVEKRSKTLTYLNISCCGKLTYSDAAIIAFQHCHLIVNYTD